MSTTYSKSLIGAFVLLAFVVVGVFGLIPLGHEGHTAEAPMQNCPYAEGGTSLCENTLSHVDNWQQFSNVILSSIFVLVSLLGVTWLLYQQFLENKYFYRFKYSISNNRKIYSYSRVITNWLSLFELSPTFVNKA